MDSTFIYKLECLDLEELGSVANTVLSRICRKLREEKGFGYEMYCMVPYIGNEAYDVEIVVVNRDTLDVWRT